MISIKNGTPEEKTDTEVRIMTSINEVKRSKWMAGGPNPRKEEPKNNPFGSIPRYHKRHNPVSRGVYENSRLCRVCDLKLSDNNIKTIPRAGMIFYTVINNELYICFGKDTKTNDLTDFGGTRNHWESPLACAVREGNEESRHVFGEITESQVKNYMCLYSSSMLIIFVPVLAVSDIDVLQISANTFASKVYLEPGQQKTRCYNEIADLVWLPEEKAKDIFAPRSQIQMFAKVRRFICSCEEFQHDMMKMKYLLVNWLPESITSKRVASVSV